MPITAIIPNKDDVDEEAVNNLKAEANTSWLSYQDTGLHLTRKEVSDWLKTWGSEKETVMPQCHG